MAISYGQKYRCLAASCTCANHRFGLFLLTRDSENMRLQGQNGQAVVQLRGSLQIVDSFVESTLLRVRHTLKRQGERGIRFELQALSSEFDRFVVAPREQQENGSEGVGPYRQRIEIDRSSDLPDGLVMPCLGGQSTPRSSGGPSQAWD